MCVESVSVSVCVCVFVSVVRCGDVSPLVDVGCGVRQTHNELKKGIFQMKFGSEPKSK